MKSNSTLWKPIIKNDGKTVHAGQKATDVTLKVKQTVKGL